VEATTTGTLLLGSLLASTTTLEYVLECKKSSSKALFWPPKDIRNAGRNVSTHKKNAVQKKCARRRRRRRRRRRILSVYLLVVAHEQARGTGQEPTRKE
jgi:hypothetical protein